MPGSKELYDKLYSEQLYTNSYNDFVAKYGTEEGQNELYQKLSEQQLYTNDINTFKGKYFADVKKKDVGVSQSSSGQPIGLSASPRNPSAYNKNIESRDWQRHQELTRTIQDAAQKNDALSIKNASKQLEQLRASNKNIASDPLLNEDLQTANKIIQKNVPTVSLQPTGAATQKPVEPVRLDLKPKAPIPTQERINKLDALDRSLQSDIQLDDEDIKNLFVKDNIQLGFSEEGKQKLAEAEDQLNKEFGEGTFTDKIAGLYNSFLKNANVANLLPMAETGRDKALIKATAMYAKQNPNGKANEEEILQMAKDIRRKELEGKAIDGLVEDFVGDNQRGLTEGYAKWWALNTGQPYMPEDENQAEQIRATLSSVVNKTKAQEASFKSKALELQGLTNELDAYGKDLNNLTPEQAQAYKETYDKATAINTDLLDNYKNIDNDVNNLGDFQNELDLFKRNYNTLLNLSAKVGASGVRLTTGLMGTAQMVGKYAPGVSVDYANTDKIKFLDDMASSIEGAVERRKSIDEINSVGDFFKVSGGVMAEQLPQLFINASTGGSVWGLGLLAASATGTKYNEIKDKKNFTESQKIIASLAVGAFEYVSEKIESNMLKNALPSYRVMSAAANGATKLELDAMRAELKGGLKNAAKRTIENVAEIGLSANQEGISEVVAQVGGNLVDRYVLNNKNVNVFDGLKDAYLTGAIMGGVITASPIIGAKIVAPFVSDESGELRKNTKKINELTNNLSEIKDEKTKEIISNSIEKLKKKNEAIIYGGVNVINNLTPEEIREGSDNYQELQQIKDQYIIIKNNKEMSDASKKAVMEPLNERYNELVTKRKQLIDKANAIQKQGSGQVPVQPKTGISQEVEQGKPQAKPQGVTKEGEGKVIPAGKRLFNEPNPETVEISKTYKEKNNIIEPEGVKIETVDVDNASKIADAYEALEDTPNDPEVQDAYNAMADETAKQHQDIVDAGYEVEIWQGEGEPYANAQEMIDDVRNNKHMYIYSTEQGFGNTPITEEQRKQNKLLQDSGFKDKNGNPLLYNDLFRFVHDFFGHTERGNGFGAVGEENAWDVHARMYTPKARRAMTTETRGQNSWVNFGPQMRNADGSLKKKGDDGYLSPKDREFAPQKMALMPEEFSQITEVVSNFDQALNKSAEALNLVAPGLKVIVGENIEDVQNQIIEAITPLIGERQAKQVAKEFATGTKGQTIFVDGKPFAVVFDKTTADSRTAGHEAWEVMLNDAFGNDQAKFKEFTAGIDSQLRAQGFDDIADALDAFASQKGYEAVKYSEYMAELGGMLVESGFGKGPLTAQQKTLLQKIGDIINKFAELFTGKKQFLDQATPEDILGFMVTISEKVAKGEDVASFFRKGEKAKSNEGVTSRKQAENIFTGKEKVPTFKSLPEIANWLEDWSKKNKIFAKDIKEVSDEEFVKKLESHTLKELAAWDGVRGQDYVSFYVGDIIDRLNPKLQKFAEARYGRMLTPAEVTLYHTVSGFASPQADPMFDSSKGLEIFDKYMNGGNPDINKLSGYADKQATIYALNDKGKKVDTGKLKFDKEGNPVYSQVSMHYAVTSLNKTKALISHFNGDVTKAMEWMTSIHSYEEISDVMGTPLKGSKALTPHENLSKENGGFGIFGFTGAKLGSYILNRVGEYSTVTKDMWYARTMARLVGDPLTKDGKAMTDPWAANTVAGAKKRKLADQAWESVAKKLNITPSDVQERMWDFEKRLYEKMGALEKASYASEGFMKTAKKLEPGLDLETKVVESRSQKEIDNIAKNYPNSELAKQEGNTIGLSEITVDGKSVYIQAIEYPENTTVKPVIAWNSKGENIAFANFRQNKDGAWYSMQSETNKSLQRKGVMTAIYNLAEKAIGKIVESKEQTPEVKAFWAKRKSRSQKNVPPVVDEVLTDDGKGNYLFVHYSDEKRDVIRPMSGSGKNFTSREEVSAISSVGGLAMYYTKAGQKENGVGDVAHTILVPKDKVYFYGTTDKGTVSHDPEGFEEEARIRFQEYKNRGNEKNPTKYAFDGNNAAAWVTKVAGENGYDMLVTNWGAAKSYRAQTTKRLTPEAEYTGFKKVEDDVFEVGDEIFLRGSYAKVTDVNGSIVRYEGTNQYGGAVSGVFDINRSNAIMIEKAKPVVTTRAQRVDVKVIPGYDRMMNNAEGIMDKTMNARNGSYNKATANAISYIQKSLAYINADDIQRNQIIRDFNEMRGEKLKKAPSVNKILGKIKDIVNVTVNEATALKEQIKMQVKAANDAVKFVNQSRNYLINKIKELDKVKKLPPQKLKLLLLTASKIDVLNERAVGKFIDNITKIFNENELQSEKYITIKEATALKDQIKLEAKAARGGVKYINELRKNLSAEIAALEKGGKITAKQAKTIINRLGKINLENPIIVSRFIDYMTKVFNDAEYADKIRIANENIKKIKRLYKGNSVQATVSTMAKNFLTLDPKKLSNIDEYLFISNQVLQAVMRTQPAVIKDVNKYIEAAAKEQAEKVKNDLLLEYQYLVDAGILDDSMSYEDILEVIDGIEDNSSQEVLDKGEDVRQYLVKMFNSLSAIGKEILSEGVDPVTGLPVDLSDDQKIVLKQFLNMDIENMSIQDAKLALEYLSNFITNGITDGMGGLVQSYVGAENFKKFQKTGAKFRDLKLFFSSRIGRGIGEYITNLNILLEQALGGQDRSAIFRALSGFNDIVNGNAKARKVANQKLIQYVEKFRGVKDFFTVENNIERGILSFLIRTNETKEELERRKGLIEQSIEKMMKGNEKEVAKAKIIQETYERIGKNAKTVQDVIDAAGKDNREAVNWWINNWGNDYNRLKDLSLNIYNADLGKDQNYTPDVYNKTDDAKEEVDNLKKSAFMMTTKDYTVKKKTGVLMEALKPSKLNSNRVVSFDFDTNNARAYEAAMVDLETAAPIRRIDGFMNSKEFNKLGSSDDVALIKRRINGYIGEIRGKNYVSKTSIQEINKTLDAIGSIGAALALGGVTQPVKQIAPVAFNTLINTGRIDIKLAFNKDANNWIDELGMPIGNRGMESLLTINTANKYLEQASKHKGQKALDLIKKASEVYLNFFLKKPDVFIARASFISYYKKQLKKKGVDVDNIDWATHKADKTAAQYAQDMVDRQQNVSDAALMGDLMTSKDPWKQVIRKTALTFMNFVLNQKARMYSDVITLNAKDSTEEDKKMARRSLAALSVEMSVYSVIGGAIAELIRYASALVMGEDETEEQKAKRRKSRYELVATNISKDFLSPIPFTDAIVVGALNEALDQYYKIAKGDEGDEEGDRFRLFEDRESSIYDNLGAAGITFERYKEMYNIFKMASTGEFEQEFIPGKRTTKYLRDRDKQTLAGLGLLSLGTNLGLLPSEIGSMIRTSVKIAKKRALSESDYGTKELYKGSNTPLPDYLK